MDCNSRSGIADVFLQLGQRDLTLHTLRLGLGTQVDVHHVTGQSLNTDTTHTFSTSDTGHVESHSV